MNVINNTGLQLNGRLTFNGHEIHAVSLDLEGTLVNLEPLNFAAHVAAAERVGITINPDNFGETSRMCPHFFGGPNKAIVEELVKAGGGTITADELLLFDRKQFDNLLVAFDTIDTRPGAIELLAALEKNRIPMTLVSVTEPRHVAAMLERSELKHFFPKERTILLPDVAKPKPDPEAYLLAAQRMNVEARHHLIFEDSPSGIKAAVDASAHVIAMPVDARPETVDHLRGLGAHLISNDWRTLGRDVIAAHEGALGSREGSLSYHPFNDGRGSRL